MRLPADFRPTHPTAGLLGYPAVDLFARAGQPVFADFYGKVRRISGRSACSGGVPGGAYGRSVYLLNEQAKRERYVTHLCCLALEVGDAVRPGTFIGTVAVPPAGSPAGSAHVHLGMRRW